MHVIGDHVCAFVQVDAQNRAAQRPHGRPVAFHVEVDFTTLRPAVDNVYAARDM